jgi:hypothetical protein
MRKGILAALAALFASAGTTGAQPAASPVEVEQEVTDGSALLEPATVGGCECEAPLPCLWGRADYLLWWTKGTPVPVPLATSAPATSPAAIPSLIGNPDTSLVLGQHNIDMQPQSGGRFGLGGWLDADRTIGLEATYFFLAQSSATQSAASSGAPGSPFLSVPFATGAALPPTEAVYALTAPGFFNGGAVQTNALTLMGVEANGIWNAHRTDRWCVDLIGGFRYLNLYETLAFSTTFLNGPLSGPLAGGFANTQDRFSTNNNFYGGQLGAHLQRNLGRFFVDTAVKLALGSMHESVDTQGTTFSNMSAVALRPAPITAVGGIFTQPTNIGRVSRDSFAVVPEADFNLGYRLTPWASIYVGYSFLYASDVVRPGNQIDRVINFTQSPVFFGGALVGPARPTPLLNTSDFWAQGLNVGIAFNF